MTLATPLRQSTFLHHQAANNINFFVAGGLGTDGYVYLSMQNFDDTTLINNPNADWQTQYVIKSAFTSTSYGNIHALCMDTTNAKIWAAYTVRGEAADEFTKIFTGLFSTSLTFEGTTFYALETGTTNAI